MMFETSLITFTRDHFDRRERHKRVPLSFRQMHETARFCTLQTTELYQIYG